MRMCDRIQCNDFPCDDIDEEAYLVPYREIDPGGIKVIMVAEAPPKDRNDYFYAQGSPFYLQTTIQAFSDAGRTVSTIQEILDSGVYITTAVKCGKTHYSLSSATIKNCSDLLAEEVAQFPDVKAFLLMGDVAIKAMNYIWKRTTGAAVIPGGSTYKIRTQPFFFKGKRVFPSYLQTGQNYLIEKSKRRMIAEDIKEALSLIR